MDLNVCCWPHCAAIFVSDTWKVLSTTNRALYAKPCARHRPRGSDLFARRLAARSGLAVGGSISNVRSGLPRDRISLLRFARSVRQRRMGGQRARSLFTLSHHLVARVQNVTPSEGLLGLLQPLLVAERELLLGFHNHRMNHRRVRSGTKPAKNSCRSHIDLTSHSGPRRRGARTSFTVAICLRTGDAKSLGSPGLVAAHPRDRHPQRPPLTRPRLFRRPLVEIVVVPVRDNSWYAPHAPSSCLRHSCGRPPRLRPGQRSQSFTGPPSRRCRCPRRTSSSWTRTTPRARATA